MAGLNHLSQILEKVGHDNFVKELSKTCRIFEKVDGNEFAFSKNHNGNIDFYKRDSSTPISIIDRTLMKKYERAIEHIESRAESVFPNFRYYTEIVTEKSNVIEYFKYPKNNLILKGVQFKNSKVANTETLQHIARNLRISPVPLVFEGILNEYESQMIMEFIQKTPDEQKEFLNRYQFTEYFFTLLNQKLTTSFLQNSLTEPIEGLIFEFDNGNLGKLVNSSLNFYTKGAPKSMYHLALSDMLSFMQEQNYFEYKDQAVSADSFYIQFCVHFFMKYYESRKENLLKIPRPEFMIGSDFDLNTKFIESQQFVNFIRSKDREDATELFKIFLNGFRKKKKRAVGLFNEEKIKAFNEEVERIQKYINKGNQIIRFSDFSKLN